MNMSTAAEKLQEFFGLNDGNESEASFTQNAHVEKSEKDYSSPNHSYFQDEKAVNKRRSRRTTKRESVVKPEPIKPEIPESIYKPQERVRTTTQESQENVRVPQKIVQMNKNDSALQQDVAGEDPVKKISILEPRTYTESKNIAKCIFRNEIVIVSFHLVEEVQARRIVDFLTGAVYALDGDIQRLGAEIFICTPPNTEIDSATAKSLLQTQFRDY